MGRFINADTFASTGQGLLGHNMYAYCGNNPVMECDPYGLRSREFQKKMYDGGYAAVLGAVIAAPFLYGISVIAYELYNNIAEALKLLQRSSSSRVDYTVYFLCATGDSDKQIIYVGRVKTCNLTARMNYHTKMGREFVFCLSNLDYPLCRVLEQRGMQYFHTLNNPSSLSNKIRGISPQNPKRYDYLAALADITNRSMYPEITILPASFWENYNENELLNGGL